MPDYHIYCVDETNHIVSRHSYVVADDLEALEKARELCGKYEVEVWQGTRIAARLAKDGTGSRQPETGPRTSSPIGN